MEGKGREGPEGGGPRGDGDLGKGTPRGRHRRDRRRKEVSYTGQPAKKNGSWKSKNEQGDRWEIWGLKWCQQQDGKQQGRQCHSERERDGAGAHTGLDFGRTGHSPQPEEARAEAERLLGVAGAFPPVTTALPGRAGQGHPLST